MWLLVACGACGTRVVADRPDALEEDGGPNVRGKLADGGWTVDPMTADATTADASIEVGTPEVGPPDMGTPEVESPDVGIDMPPPRQCTAPDRRCDGKTPQTCDADGAWQSDAACPYLCLAGACAGVCSPGDVGCAGGAPETCDATGAWKVGTACPNVCSNGACIGRCVPKSHQCSGTVRQLCDASGEWRAELTCPYVCIGTDCAGVCAPGKTQCLAGILQTCSASGSWQSTGTATRELLVNPGFDAGETGWINPGIRIVYPANGSNTNNTPAIAAQSAPNLAWLGGLNREDDVLSQSLAIPQNTASAMLSFYYAIFTDETSGAENDVLDVTLLAGNRTILSIHFSDNDATRTWTHVTAPLPANVAGQTLTLQFHSVNNSSLISSFYVDSVSVQAVACP